MRRGPLARRRNTVVPLRRQPPATHQRCDAARVVPDTTPCALPCCCSCPSSPPSSAERVRLNAPGLGGPVTGTLVAWESDTLFVRVEGDAAGLTLMLPADSVTRLDVRRERAMTLEGLGIGLLAGTLLAVVASPDWVDDNGECTTLPCVAYKVSPNVGTRVEVLGLLGAFVGGIVGSSAKKVTWAPVQVDGLQ